MEIKRKIQLISEMNNPETSQERRLEIFGIIKKDKLGIRDYGKNGSNVLDGFDGNQREIGPMGIQGEKGEQGIQGEIGPMGPRGLQGIQGIQGVAGLEGQKGKDGLNGITPDINPIIDQVYNKVKDNPINFKDLKGTDDVKNLIKFLKAGGFRGGGGSGSGVSSFNTRTGAVTLTSGDVTGALGFTPYDATNPAGYITASSLTGYVPYTGATTNVDLGANSITAIEFLVGDSSAYTPPAQPSAFMIQDLPNTSSSVIIGNINRSTNGSGDLVWINDSTDANVSTNIFDIGFNSSIGDTSKQTFAFPFPAPNVCDFTNGSADIYTPAHGLNLNQVLQFDGTLPPEFSLLTNYYVVAITDADNFQVSATYGGSPITPSVDAPAVDWAIFGADLAGAFNLGIDPFVVVTMYTDGGDAVTATFTLSSVQVTWTTGLTASATANVNGAFPFSAVTGSDTSYQYNTDGRQAYINGMDKNFTWYINGFTLADQVWDVGLTQAKLYNTVLSDVNLTKTFGATFDGSGGVLTGANYVSVKIPYNCLIQNFTIRSINPSNGADLPGTINVDIKYAGSSIIGGAGNKVQLLALASNTANIVRWSRPKVKAGDELFFYINGAVTSCTKVEVFINAILN